MHKYINTMIHTYLKIQVPNLTQTPVVQGTCGDMHTIFLSADGNIHMMGINDEGQQGLGVDEDNEPIDPFDEDNDATRVVMVEGENKELRNIYFIEVRI